MNPAQLADRLEPELTELGELVEANFTDRRETDDVQSRRRQAIRDFDRILVTIVQALRSFFRAAGRGTWRRVFAAGIRGSSVARRNRSQLR